MDITAPIALKNDVLIIPVGDLDERTRRSIDCDDGDFAISRPRARSTSTVVDEAAAALIEQFRRPRTIVEAVVLFSKARRFDATTVLDDAYRLVRLMVDQGFMVVPDGDTVAAQAPAMHPRYVRGDRIGAAVVLRLLQFVEDTEVYVARHAEAGACVVKMQRPGAHGQVTDFNDEADVLAALGGCVAPRLIERGSLDGSAYLVMEHCAGLESEMLAFDDRQRAADAPEILLSLLRRVARAYATLHEHDVVHGDVHPRNVLVDETRARLIDFGLGAMQVPGSRGVSHQRGGVAFFHEPETALAALDGRAWPPVTKVGEQYSVAALLYYLLTGTHYVDFSLGRPELMREIAEAPPVPLSERGLPHWPALEACLFRGLAKNPGERFPSITALADDLDRVEPPARTAPGHVAARGMRATLTDAAERVLEQTALDGRWFTQGLPQGPTASINYGAAGIAYAVGRVAAARRDPSLLARADAWACRAAQLAHGDANAFTNPSGELSLETVGRVSPYHTGSGVAAVGALVAYMTGDDDRQRLALTEFESAAGGSVDNLDLTLGLSSTIIGAAHLWHTLPGGPSPLRAHLLSFGNERIVRLWTKLATHPPIGGSTINNLGIAHGWAGFVYATLTWCATTAMAVPGGLETRLEELAQLAEPSGRGLIWPWALAERENANYMPGWCNGSAGYVHLWTAAARAFPAHERFIDLATGAAWDAFDAHDTSGTLCCGLAGRAYALLELYKHSGDGRWLERARTLGYRSAQGTFEPDYPHSLYKGLLVLPVLAADLDDPQRSSQPFFTAPPV